MKSRVARAVLLVCVTLFSASRVLAGNLFAIHLGTGELYRVSQADASLSLIGNTGPLLIGSLERFPDGLLYGITIGADPILYRIDPNTAAATLVGRLGVSIVEGGLAFAPDGAAYATTGVSDDLEPQLVSINMNTGAATVIGIISGGPHDINGLVWRSDGMLVGLDRATNALLAINPATAVSSVIVTLVPNVGGVGGMTILDGTGYFATGAENSGSNELYRFNLFTGAHTRVGSFAPAITGFGMSGLASTSAVGDQDSDGVPDAADLCPDTIGGIVVDASGCPPVIPGDFDRDGDVDNDDFGIFQRCRSGPNVPANPNCADRP